MESLSIILVYALFICSTTKNGKTANDLIPAKDVQEVFHRQLGKDHGSYAWNHLHSTVHNKDGASIREIAQWFFGSVSTPQGPVGRRSALLVIDVQNDFCPPDGSLAVGEGTAVIPIVNDLRKRCHFNAVAHTQDFHPADHCSFASNNKDNPDCKLFTPLRLKNGDMQVMWPDHCVQGSNGTKFHKDLVMEKSDIVVQKGKNREVDSYSGFYDNDKREKTELSDLLKKQGVTDVYVTGLAYDYCVGYSALDAFDEGFKVSVVEDATRGVAPDTTKAMKEKLIAKGIQIIQSKDIPYHGFVQN